MIIINFYSLFLRARFWLIDFIHGSPIGKPYKEIRCLQEHTLAYGVRIRGKKLQNILTYAKNNTEYYRSIMGNSLCDFPVVNKSILLQHYDEICVPIEKIPSQNGEKLHIQSTSGSTGTPFRIPQDRLKRLRRIAELKYYGSIVGFRTHDALVHLRIWNKWQSKSPKQIKSENIYPFDISEFGQKKIAELIQLVNEKRAVCIRGYASSFDLIDKYLQKHPIALPELKIIIAGAEALEDHVRTNIKRDMQCEIISQYANEECGILAQERTPTKDSNNVMYLNNADYFFELLKMDSDDPAKFGEVGRLVITDLHNYAFPMIRYDCGDAAILLPPNKYSNGYPVIGKLFGRQLDLCYCTNGEPFFPMTLARILKYFDKILQWQFIQKEEKLFLLKLNLKPVENIELYIKPAIEALKAVLGQDANIRIELVDDIPILASGKRKPVTNEWKRK
jgi:phenylacetate-CoA ligase